MHPSGLCLARCSPGRPPAEIRPCPPAGSGVRGSLRGIEGAHPTALSSGCWADALGLSQELGSAPSLAPSPSQLLLAGPRNCLLCFDQTGLPVSTERESGAGVQAGPVGTARGGQCPAAPWTCPRAGGGGTSRGWAPTLRSASGLSAVVALSSLDVPRCKGRYKDGVFKLDTLLIQTKPGFRE